jgi:hypothetical protein
MVGSDKAMAAEKGASATKATAERGTEMAGAEKATTAEAATPTRKISFDRMSDAGPALNATLLGNPSLQSVKLVASPEAHVSHPPPGSAPPADW